MGFFGKDRHGKMITVVKGRKFVWEIPNITKYSNTVLDSANVDSFSGVEFHFHMTVNQKSEIGFYLHYKGPPIPKYSYYFAAKDTNPPPANASWFPPENTSYTKVSRQFTAHTIPQDTERCGHWNVFNPEQLEHLLEGTDGTLMVVFQFDEDKMVAEERGDTKFVWQIPRFRQILCAPFTSRGIVASNQLFVIRLDRKGNDGDYFAFVFSKSVNLPPMSMRLIASNGAVLAAAEKPAEGQALAPMTIKRDELMSNVGTDDTIVLELVVFKTGNPLEQLNQGGKFESAMAPTNEAPKTAQVGKQSYVVVADDL